jgi:hypothetical protein
MPNFVGVQMNPLLFGKLRIRMRSDEPQERIDFLPGVATTTVTQK